MSQLDEIKQALEAAASKSPPVFICSAMDAKKLVGVAEAAEEYMAAHDYDLPHGHTYQELDAFIKRRQSAKDALRKALEALK